MPFPIYALVVLGVNLFVILWGAVVRASGSGAGCGEHWPLCNGEILPQSPATATLIEFTHRVTSGIALILVIALFWWSRRAFPPGHRARTGALWSLVFIGSEALVGAGLVLFHLVGDDASPLRAIYLSVHLLNTFLLLAALSLTAHWATHEAPWQRPGSGAAPWLLGAGLLAVLIVGMSGAVTALGDTLFPSASLAAGFREDASPTAHFLVRLRVLHPVLALLTGLYLSVMVWQVWRLRPAAVEAPWGRWLTTLVLLQLAVGLSNLLLRAPTPVQLAHLFVADLLWLTLVLFTATALTAAPVRDRLDPAAVSPGVTA
jgi:heme A synthase